MWKNRLYGNKLEQSKGEWSLDFQTSGTQQQFCEKKAKVSWTTLSADMTLFVK
jgi:hypothetical protein